MSFLLQQALSAHRAGDLVKAQRLYQQQLAANPNDYNALQLLGSIHGAQGQQAKAIELQLKSIALHHGQPHVHLNLAICYKQLNDFENAEKYALEAIKLDPNNLSSYHFLIRLQTGLQNYFSAVEWLEKALLLFTNEPGLLALKANLMRLRDNYQEAISLYQSLVAEYPQSVQYQHDLALTYRMMGESQTALGLYQQLEQAGLSSYTFFHNMANAYSDIGELSNAIDYYRQALSINSGYVDSHVNLNELLWELGDSQHFLQSYSQGFAQHPENMPLKFAYCRSLLRLRQYQQCHDFLQAVSTELRNSADYFQLLGLACKGIGKFEAAIEHLHYAVSLDNKNPELSVSYAQTLIENNQLKSAQKHLEMAVEITPHHQLLWALLGVCWRIENDPRASLLNNYTDLVREYTIDVPAGFESVSQFCDALKSYLTSLHTSTKQPLNQTLTGGTQTRGNLFDNHNELIKALKVELDKCVKRYVNETQEYEYLPIYQSQPNNIGFKGSWSVALKGGGHHTPHVHPMGWLSSAFYVALPENTKNHQTQQGWFELGRPNIDCPVECDAEVRIKPGLGKLILFRSYMWHSTVPFESDQTRMTVAFDVGRDRSGTA